MANPPTPLPSPLHDPRAEEIKALARDYAELAIQTLVTVARDPIEKGAARVMAAREILARGFGAPERRLEATYNHHIYDERKAHLDALQQLTDKPPITTDYKEIKND